MSAPGYESYKLSGVKWLGDIPSHWRLSRLGYLSQSGMGQTILREMLDAEPNAKALPVFSASESDQEFGYLSSPTIVLAPGDLIVGARGSIGMARRVTVPSTCTQTTIWVRPNREIMAPDYLYWSMVGGRAALFPFDKTAIPMLTVEQVRAGRIAIPPPAEQAAIAAFLDRETGKIDALVEAQTRLIELLKEKRQAVISDAVTKGLDPAAPMKDSGVEWLGQVPAHWEVKRLGSICSKIGSGKTPSGGAEAYAETGIAFLRSQNVYDEGLWLDELVYIPEAVDEEMSNTRVQPGDVLLNITGASLGRTCIVPEPFERANVNQHVCIIRLQDVAQRDFVSMAMKSISTKGQIDATQNGAAREGLNFQQIAELRVALPPENEASEIVGAVCAQIGGLDRLTEQAEAAISLLQERRAALIAAAVTGKIDVRGLAPEQAEAA